MYSIELITRRSHDTIARYHREADLQRLRPRFQYRLIRFVKIVSGHIDHVTKHNPKKKARSHPTC